jgi:hypothetical protein
LTCGTGEADRQAARQAVYTNVYHRPILRTDGFVFGFSFLEGNGENSAKARRVKSITASKHSLQERPAQGMTRDR